MYVAVLTQLYSQKNCSKNQLHVSALYGRAIVRLNLESQRKIHTQQRVLQIMKRGVGNEISFYNSVGGVAM
jgi:hypothetical protein